jgi:hypothetical protein
LHFNSKPKKLNCAGSIRRETLEVIVHMLFSPIEEKMPGGAMILSPGEQRVIEQDRMCG